MLTLLICSWAFFSLCTSGVSTRNRSPRPLLSSKSFLYFTWRAEKAGECNFADILSSTSSEKHYKLRSWSPSHTESADLLLGRPREHGPKLINIRQPLMNEKQMINFTEAKWPQTPFVGRHYFCPDSISNLIHLNKCIWFGMVFFFILSLIWSKQAFQNKINETHRKLYVLKLIKMYVYVSQVVYVMLGVLWDRNVFPS